MQNTNQQGVSFSLFMISLTVCWMSKCIGCPCLLLWSKLRSLTVCAGSLVKYTFHSEQSRNRKSFRCFIFCRNQLKKHMHKTKGNSGHRKKVICSQIYCQHNAVFFSLLIPQKRNHSVSDKKKCWKINTLWLIHELISVTLSLN